MGSASRSREAADYSPLRIAELIASGNSGRPVSIPVKRKGLDKFGENPDSDAMTFANRQTVWNLGANSGANETLQTTNSITHVEAGSGDTQSCRVEGHYITGDGDLVFSVQNVTLTATTPVALSQPLARCTRLYVADGGIPTGPIDATIGSGGTAVARIAAGDVQTQKCATAVSYKDWWFITNFGSAVIGGASVARTFRLEVRPLFDSSGAAYSNPSWRPLTRDWLLTDGGRAEFARTAPIIIGPNTDVRISTWGTGSNAQVVANMGGYLATDLDLVDVADPAAA